MQSHFCSPDVATPVSFRRFPRELHSVAKQASFKTQFVRVPARFWSDFGRVWEAKNGSQNRFWGGFLPCFFRMPFLKRFFCDFCRFLKVRTLILVRTANVLEDFHEIDVFEKVAKMCRFWLRFRRSKTRKIEKKWC